MYCTNGEIKSQKSPCAIACNWGQSTDTPLSTGIVGANRNSEHDLLTRAGHCHCQSRASTVSMVERLLHHFYVYTMKQKCGLVPRSSRTCKKVGLVF